ncbi:MAG: thioredoxin family protein [Bacteroidaceae bacterium]|nr:thioredoxin family protein [Bacteroidaceae bacterium]
MKKLFTLLMLLVTAQMYAQFQDPVQMKHSLKVNGDEAVLTFTAEIDNGRHLYSTDLAEGGPTSATLNIEKIAGAEPVGKLTPGAGAIEMYDPMFEMQVKYFEISATFTQKFKITASEFSIEGYMQYGACNDENCLPPTSYDFSVNGKAEIAKAAPVVKKEEPKKPKETKPTEKKEEPKKPKETKPAEKKEVSELVPLQPAEPVAAEQATVDSVQQTQSNETYISQLWTPVVDKLQAFEETKDRSLWVIFLLGLGGGFVALLTPCVWPIIPMTMSFFLKRTKSRRQSLTEAITYGISIIVIYLALGLIVTFAFGASALNALSTNAIFNIFFCLLLVLFGASFLGGFELTLPSSWVNKVDEKASNTTGLLSIFLMAFTLALVSFSCTGPIIGFLLVEMSTKGEIFGPAVGMFGFALALALPFTLFAIFPSLLKQAPRSGGWMNTIKVVLGFIELAFALKFFSVADLAYGWRLLDREVFLALWIVLFICLGLYLLNIIRFPHDDEGETKTSVPRFFLALASLAFAVYMIPGLWGAPCKAISAFAPPMWTQDFNLNKNVVHPVSYDYEEGMRIAREQNKPVLLDFTGHGCVNCRELEAAIWTDDRVINMLQDEFVLISLYVDDRTPLPEIMTVEEQGTLKKLRNIGDKWSYLQRVKFGANAQPFHVPVDNMGNPLNGAYSINTGVEEYLKFLEEAKSNYNK